MAAEREPPGVADYVVTALSPVLVMLMVGSLVFFLVEVLYAGKYSGRLLYTLFFFVTAAVLVARISIQYDAGRAALYGIALAVATYLALLAYVEYPSGWLRSWGWLVNLGLMAVVWWSAHKLTWDCTHIDEKRQSSGRGLLSAAGLDADEKQGPGDRNQESTQPVIREPQASAKPEPKKKAKKGKKAKKPQGDSRLWDWIERYKAHRGARRKAGHTPGVWVLYFALAALPLFALGQSLIDPGDADRRRATFLQMSVYIASALGLLVTTSLLGVRRYLRQRKAKIPGTMTASWLGLGGALILAFLVVGAFLPRPHSEVPWFGIERAGKSVRSASKYAQLGDSAGKGEGRGGSRSKAGDGSASGKGGRPDGGTKGEKGSGGKGQGGKGGSQGKGDQSGGNEKGGGKGQGNESEAQKDGSVGHDPEGSEKQEGDDAKEEGGSRSGNPQHSPQVGGALEAVARVVKWIVFAVVALLVVFGLFFGVLKYLAPFTDWARRWLDGIRNWWASLFGKSQANPGREAGGATPPLAPVRPPPFADYSDPFADGTAEGRDPAELVAYTFEALDAWAHDRGAGREPTETPLEFSRRLGEAFPEQAGAFARLATLYTRLAYSTLPLPGNALALLEEAWEQMVRGSAVGA